MEKLRDQNFYFHSFLHTSNQRDITNVRFDVRFYIDVIKLLLNFETDFIIILT